MISRLNITLISSVIDKEEYFEDNQYDDIEIRT